MGEDSFFNALFNVMWNMETDIFSEKDKTLGLLADIVPRCKKQRKRLEAMYDCGAMELIENAVADREHYVLNMKRAVRMLMSELNISREKALFSVNQIAELWDGDLELITEYDENENLNNENTSDSKKNTDGSEQSSNEEHADTEQSAQNTNEDNEQNIGENKNPDSEEQNTTDESNNNENKQDGDENMIFLQDVAEEENAETQEEQQVEEVQDDGGGGGGEEEQSPPPPPRDSLFKKIVEFWCKSELEEGRPFMIACPIGWILIILCSALGALLIYDIPLGDKFYVPTFAFMFSVLTTKRLYRHESTGRFSLLIGIFYLAAMGRVLWLGKGYPPIVCVPLALVALLVFNNGKLGTWLDESKKHSFFAYLIIIIFSAAVTVGAYSIQQVDI